MMKSRSVALLGMTLWALAACDSTKPKPAVDLVFAPASGNGQSGVAGVPLGNIVRAKAVDEDGKGVSGVSVNWNVSVGGGSIALATSTTADDGVATSGAWTLGTIAGTNALSATAAGVEKTLTFLATGVAGSPATITIQGGNLQATAAGSAVAISPSVRVTDQFTNPVSAVTVTFTVTGGGGSVTGPNANTNVNGIATVGGWTLGPASGANTLAASVSVGVAPAIFNATATSPPTQLAVTTQPAGAINGEVFDIQPAVSIRDASNNLVPTSTALVTASIASGTGTLTGNLTVAAINGVATFINLGVNGTSPVTLKFTSANLTEAVSTSFTPGDPPPLNLTIDRVHLNQAAQSYGGEVPLVAGRQALARVFVKANVTNTAQPSVRLTTYVNGAQFKQYVIPAPQSPTKLIDEAEISKSWNVLIPASDVVAGMSIFAEVDPGNTVTESSDLDNVYPVSGTPLALDVRQVNTMKVTFVPVTQPSTAAGNITEANKDSAVDFARRIYPIDTFDIQVHAPFAYGSTMSGASYDNTWTNLLNAIDAMRVAEAPDRYFYGLAHPAYSSGGTGLGRLGQGSAIGMDFLGKVSPSTDYYRMTIAHEWGHNFNRQHIACGGPAGPDPNYPYDALTTVGTNGFDVTSLGQFIRKATDFKEFMSYCQPLWISDYTYKAVMEWRTNHPAPAAGARQNVLLIWGQIGPNGVVLEPAYEIQAPVQFPTESGPYTVQALDESGRSMFSISFAGAETDHAPGVRTFAYAVPLPASGARPATLRLLNGTTEMTRRARAVNSLRGGATANAIAAPTRLTHTTNGRARLEWDAATYPGAMVRDPVSGEILAFLTGGSGEIAVARDVDVVFSTGVTSVRQRVSIVPR
jgi:hypothetical protein